MNPSQFRVVTLPVLMSGLLLAACQNGAASDTSPVISKTNGADSSTRLTRSELATFDEPWAMAFLPDGRLLVTEKRGQLKLFDPKTGHVGTVSGVPSVAYGGQGGLGDVVLHPSFPHNHNVYLSFVEKGSDGTVDQDFTSVFCYLFIAIYCFIYNYIIYFPLEFSFSNIFWFDSF